MVTPWISGTAVRGDGRGRQIGFPTANLTLDVPTDRPSEGVWACWARLGEHTHQAALHVGPRPTFAHASATVELHLLDFPDRDLYGETIAFQCVQKLRDIQKFATIEELATAIENDCEHVRRILTS